MPISRISIIENIYTFLTLDKETRQYRANIKYTDNDVENYLRRIRIVSSNVDALRIHKIGMKSYRFQQVSNRDSVVWSNHGGLMAILRNWFLESFETKGPPRNKTTTVSVWTFSSCQWRVGKRFPPAIYVCLSYLSALVATYGDPTRGPSPDRTRKYIRKYINGLVQGRRNSSALAIELRLSCTNPSIFDRVF